MYLQKNSQPNHIIGAVHAVDLDKEQNAEVRYAATRYCLERWEASRCPQLRKREGVYSTARRL